MLPASNVRRTICAFPVTDRQVNDLEIEFSGTKQEVEVTERIKATKVGTVDLDQIIVVLPKGLCTAQGILDRLPKQPGESKAKKLVANYVEKRIAWSSIGYTRRTPFTNSPFPDTKIS